MSAIFGIIAITAVILAIEAPSLWKKKLIKELAVFLVLLLLGFGISMAKAFNMKIPNPIDWITVICKPISDVMFSLLR